MGEPRKEEGSALLFVLFVMLMTFNLGMAYLAMATAEFRGSGGQKDALKALFLADAGIEAAVAKLLENPTFSHVSGFIVTLEGIDGQVTVGVGSEEPARVTAIAQVGAARRKVVADVSRGGKEGIEILTWQEIK